MNLVSKKTFVFSSTTWTVMTWKPFQCSVLLPNEDYPWRWFMASCAWLWDRWEAAETSGARGGLCHIMKQVHSFVHLLPRCICHCGDGWYLHLCPQISLSAVCSIKTYMRRHFSTEHVIAKRCFRIKNKLFLWWKMSYNSRVFLLQDVNQALQRLQVFRLASNFTH